MLVFLRCPAQFCEFWSEILTSYLYRVCRQTESEPSFLFFFRTSYDRFCIFPDRCIGHISRTKKKKKKGLLSICRLMHDQHRVKKPNLIQMRIDRSVANLPLWQHLGWPSSYQGTEQILACCERLNTPNKFKNTSPETDPKRGENKVAMLPDGSRIITCVLSIYILPPTHK